MDCILRLILSFRSVIYNNILKSSSNTRNTYEYGSHFAIDDDKVCVSVISQREVVPPRQVNGYGGGLWQVEREGGGLSFNLDAIVDNKQSIKFIIFAIECLVQGD